MYKVSIPEISDQELWARYQRIKPIVDIDGIKYYLRDYTQNELRRISFFWSRREDKREIVDMSEYVLAAEDFECIHTYGHYALFKPSIAEVLAQISEVDLPYVDAFEIIDYPQTSNELRKNKMVFDNGFHISTVRLYRKRER